MQQDERFSLYCDASIIVSLFWFIDGWNYHQCTRWGGRYIPVQSTTAGIRKSIGEKGKASIPAGRPPIGKAISKSTQKPSCYHLPIRNKPQGKRPHNLAKSVSGGIQNAGK